MMRLIILSLLFVSLLACQASSVAPPVPASEIEALLQLAANGNSKAQHRLCYGYSYAREGLPRDPEKAFRWCEIAADSGLPSSLTLFAEKFYYGEGVAIDRARALQLYQQGADKGHMHAQYMVAQYYLRGDVVERDPERGLSWLIKSAQQGHKQALDLLERMRAGGAQAI